VCLFFHHQYGGDEGKTEGDSQRFCQHDMNYKCEGYSSTKEGFGVVLYHPALRQLIEFLSFIPHREKSQNWKVMRGMPNQEDVQFDKT